MKNQSIPHKTPSDLKAILDSSPKIKKIWKDITPLARNEWICWIESVKKEDTRKNKLQRIQEDLLNGKRRPCCWIGCPHRKDKPLSPSIKGILNKKHR